MFRSFLRRYKEWCIEASAMLVAAIVAALLAPPLMKRVTNGEISGWSDFFQRFHSTTLDTMQWIAIGVCACVVAAMVSFYFWEKSGGLYYSRYPIAKAMDELNQAGQLKDVNVEALLSRVDIKADKESQVAQFRAEVSKNNGQR